MTRVLIIEPGVSRGALAAARSLARAGNEVAVAGQARGPASWSRAATRFHRITAATDDADRFTQEVAGAVRHHGYEVVLAAGDPEALVLSARRDDIPAHVPYPPHGVLVGLGDKLELCERARAVGLRTPGTTPATEGAISAIEGPTVVKSRLHGDPQRGARRIETEIAETPEEASVYVARLKAAGLEPLLQEVIGGQLMAVALVLGRDGSMLGLVQQRAQLTWPARAGISVRAVVEDVDRALADRIVNLLRDSGFYGLAEIQFIDPGDCAPYLIDVNPRIYGSLGLAIAAGVDLPNLALLDALERPVVPAGAASTGVRYQWLEGELRRAIEDGRPLGGAIAALRHAPGATHSISSLKDPAPLFRHVLDLARRALGKLLSVRASLLHRS
jgi:predicted ATP-grasp superfamily ATP-dependent carboligase